MSAETILENILLEIGRPAPAPQITSDDPTIQLITAFMNAAGRDISRRAEWTRLDKGLRIPDNTVGLELPADFYKVAEGGAVYRGRAPFQPIRPIVEPTLWVMLQARPPKQPYYHLANGRILFTPPLDSRGAVLRYISKNWVENGKTQFDQNGDIALIPERLIEKGAVWRWRRHVGLPFDDMVAEYEADMVAEIRADRGPGALPP